MHRYPDLAIDPLEAAGGVTIVPPGGVPYSTFSYAPGVSDTREEGLLIVPMYVLVANWAVYNTPAYYFWNAINAVWVYGIGSGYVDSGRGQGPNGTYPAPPVGAASQQNHVRPVPECRDPLGVFWTAAQRAAVGWIGPMGYLWPPPNLAINVQKENGPARWDWRDPRMAFPLLGGANIVGDYVRPFWSPDANIVENWQLFFGE